MTTAPRGPSPGEWADWLYHWVGNDPEFAEMLHARVAQLMLEAAAAEREACARIAARSHYPWERDRSSNGWLLGEAIAAAIRARGERRAETAP